MIKSIVDFFLDLIYPRNIYCLMCKDPIHTTEKYSLCKNCHKKVNWVNNTCEKCGKIISIDNTINRCFDCINSKHLFQKNIACVLYDDNTKKLVHNLKFNKKTYLAYHMAEIMSDKLLESNLEIDYMIPVPLHKNKKRKRGFNQSELLCKYMSEKTNIIADYKTLIKCNETLEQNKLNKMERQKNLKDAFQVRNNPNMINKNILLVDDVFTTGNTIDACCGSLNRLKPKNIYSITFSIGKNT
ncbi:ComF family protein [Anaeromicrobium sediminis]|uniref:Double zinc ribbon domain-containing protein n=1 Tax=Anaeromicrobium sediminis TaxID=1478221 RepID=A0A267MKP6_9FIRM|nr:ComF family protein [Anaeromicrobium sediminis]PAB59373.1 hypothetical protein CCE28_10970 [Anaeromicrobium sediminis]